MIINPSLIEIKDEGTVQGFVRSINFTGSGIAATVSGISATVNSAGGGGGSVSATRVVATAVFPVSRNKRINIIDAAITATDKILAWVSGIADGLPNAGDLVDVHSIRAIAKTGSFDLDLDFLTPWAGSISIDYMVIV